MRGVAFGPCFPRPTATTCWSTRSAATPRKLRLSVTDRCNFRCDFCMPTNPVWLDQKEVLTFEEITRVAAITARMGVRSIRVSGGEPLVRKELEKLVKMLVAVPGIRARGSHHERRAAEAEGARC